MDREALEELKTLCDSATPGPWNARFYHRSGRVVNVVTLADTIPWKSIIGDDGKCQFDHDAEFIAAARTYLPQLIAEVELNAVYLDIKAERARQDSQWGGPGHDDAHSESDWCGYRHKFERRIKDASGKQWVAIQREQLVKIAALAVAQIEALDRKHSPPALQSGGSNER